MSADGKNSLAGRRIVITRAEEQSDELLGRLADAGAETLLLPMVRFVEAPDTSALDHAIGDLGRFDWLILTSANAVRFYYRRLRMTQTRGERAVPRCAVIGSATQKALESEDPDAARVSRRHNGTGAALVSVLSAELAGKQVLLPRSDFANDDLPATLRAAGAIVTAVVAYCTVPPESMDSGLLAALRRGDVDAVAFFSPSAFHHFVRLLGVPAVREIAARAAFAAIGPTTAAAIREGGISVSVEAEEATAASLVAALERHFAPQAVRKERS